MVCQRMLGICNLEIESSYHGNQWQHRSVKTEFQETSAAERLSAALYWREAVPPCQADLVINVNKRCGRKLKFSSEMDG